VFYAPRATHRFLRSIVTESGDANHGRASPSRIQSLPPQFGTLHFDNPFIT